MHVFLFYFGWPLGSVWSNVSAEPICIVFAAILVFLFRDHIGKHFMKWLHKHHNLHLEREKAENDSREAESRN